MPARARIRSTRAPGRAAFLLLFTQAACAAHAAPALAPLPVRIDSIVTADPVDRTHWGISVRDLATGATLYEHNARRHFIPASNTKLVVTLVAMGELGPDWRWQTDVIAIGPGPEPDALLVRASGDPTLSERFADSDTAALDSIARMVHAAGVRTVRGDLVIDASRFPDERVHSAWEVGDLPYGYAAPTGAFAIGEGTFRVIRRPGAAPGRPASLEVIGGIRRQPLIARVSTDTAGAPRRWDIEYLDRRDTVFVRGSIAVDAPTDTARLAVADPDAYAGRAFVAALERAGVRLLGRVRVERDSAKIAALPGARERVATRVSPPLREVIAAILQPSQNWIAEQLLKTLGAERGEAGTWSAGLDVERRYLVERVGLDSLAFSLRDASGLTAQNLLSPDAIIAMLAHAHAAPWAHDYAAALPAPGEDDGTLSARLAGLEDRLRAKTGTIANVNSLSGYLRMDDGSVLAFSILTNASGLPSGRVRAAIDDVVRAIDLSGRTP